MISVDIRIALTSEVWRCYRDTASGLGPERIPAIERHALEMGIQRCERFFAEWRYMFREQARWMDDGGSGDDVTLDEDYYYAVMRARCDRYHARLALLAVELPS